MGERVIKGGPGTYRPRTVPGGLPNESPVDTHDSTAPASSAACGCRGSGYSAGEFGKLRPHRLGEFLDGLARVLPRGHGQQGDHLPLVRVLLGRSEEHTSEL